MAIDYVALIGFCYQLLCLYNSVRSFSVLLSAILKRVEIEIIIAVITE